MFTTKNNPVNWSIKWDNGNVIGCHIERIYDRPIYPMTLTMMQSTNGDCNMFTKSAFVVSFVSEWAMEDAINWQPGIFFWWIRIYGNRDSRMRHYDNRMIKRLNSNKG